LTPSPEWAFERSSKVKKQAIEKAMAYLQAAGATYHIVDSDGNEVANTINTRKKKSYRHVGYADHYNPYLEKFKDSAGSFEMKILVPEQFNVEAYRGALAATLSTRFGKGNSLTKTDRKARTIDVLVVRPQSHEVG
jgi:hypothetical protein